MPWKHGQPRRNIMNIEKRISRLEQRVPEPPRAPHFLNLIMHGANPTGEQKENAMREMKRLLPNEGGLMLLFMDDGTCHRPVAGGFLVMEFDSSTGEVVNVKKELLKRRS